MGIDVTTVNVSIAQVLRTARIIHTGDNHANGLDRSRRVVTWHVPRSAITPTQITPMLVTSDHAQGSKSIGFNSSRDIYHMIPPLFFRILLDRITPQRDCANAPPRVFLSGFVHHAGKRRPHSSRLLLASYSVLACFSHHTTTVQEAVDHKA